MREGYVSGFACTASLVESAAHHVSNADIVVERAVQQSVNADSDGRSAGGVCELTGRLEPFVGDVADIADAQRVRADRLSQSVGDVADIADAQRVRADRLSQSVGDVADIADTQRVCPDKLSQSVGDVADIADTQRVCPDKLS